MNSCFHLNFIEKKEKKNPYWTHGTELKPTILCARAAVLILHVPHVFCLIILQLKRGLKLSAERARGRLNIEHRSGGGCRWTAVTSAVCRKKTASAVWLFAPLPAGTRTHRRARKTPCGFYRRRVCCAASSEGLWIKAKRQLPKAPECQIISALNNCCRQKLWNELQNEVKSFWELKVLNRAAVSVFPFPQ